MGGKARGILVGAGRGKAREGPSAITLCKHRSVLHNHNIPHNIFFSTAAAAAAVTDLASTLKCIAVFSYLPFFSFRIQNHRYTNPSAISIYINIGSRSMDYINMMTFRCAFHIFYRHPPKMHR